MSISYSKETRILFQKLGDVIEKYPIYEWSDYSTVQKWILRLWAILYKIFKEKEKVKFT